MASPTRISFPIRRLAFAATLSLLPSLALADWVRYENKDFIAYSNAPAPSVVEVLYELEYIRAAAEQTPAFFIPEDRPKTLLILPASHEEFLDFAPSDTMAGFAQPLAGGAAIVMPVTAASGDAGSVIRHEFAHTLLFNEWFSYPEWFSEGFAEIVSNIAVDRRRNTYSIGEMPARYGRRFNPLLDWNVLVTEQFKAHAQPDPDLIQSAYAQNWLLVHFLTLSDDPERDSELDHYFSLVNSGRASLEAFEEVYGMSPAALWSSSMGKYVERPPVRRFEFSPAVLDLAFDQSPAAAEDIVPITRYFRDKAHARRPGDVAELPIGMLVGRWDRLKYTEQCSEPFEIGLQDGEEVVRIEAYYSAPGADPVPALFRATKTSANVFELVNITADVYPNVAVTSDYLLTLRSDSVVCFDRHPFRRACMSILQRCDD